MSSFDSRWQRPEWIASRGSRGSSASTPLATSRSSRARSGPTTRCTNGAEDSTPPARAVRAGQADHDFGPYSPAGRDDEAHRHRGIYLGAGDVGQGLAPRGSRARLAATAQQSRTRPPGSSAPAHRRQNSTSRACA